MKISPFFAHGISKKNTMDQNSHYNSQNIYEKIAGNMTHSLTIKENDSALRILVILQKYVISHSKGY